MTKLDLNPAPLLSLWEFLETSRAHSGHHFIPKSSLERAPGNWLNCHLSESECDCDGIIFHLFTSSVLLLGVTTDSHVPPFLEES
ncbi:hypothetical protein PHYPO_G00194780 [Pangasianodon hypophthalmus]|uniref:Uncharacterized protein n=1 Tax=Pangasianodon hypophthalmus TaxID=310915 RepID=A0A5N5PIH9_PANHP|nr:hypothetical protein PHYPO_G00194780 [Pangasianodon hypophthalmus]